MLFIRPEQRSEHLHGRHDAELARWIHEASNPFADWYFGDREVAGEVIAEWTRRPTSELYLDRALFLIDEREAPLGVLIGMGGRELAHCRRADFAAFCADLGEGPEAEAVIDAVMAAARNLFAPVDDDEFYISRVATAPNRRGQGLGRKLVAGAVEFAKATGFRKFRLDVSHDNDRARRAYGALGFEVDSISVHRESGLEYVSMFFAG